MEDVKSRSESPFSRSKGKNYSTSENGNKIIEQVKPKKKNLRSRNKHHLNGKDDLGSNGQNSSEEEQITSNEVDTNYDSNNVEHENETLGTDSIENGNGLDDGHKVNENKDGTTSFICVTSEEVIIAEADGDASEDGIADKFESTEEDINVDENSSEVCINTSKIETESCAEKDVLMSQDSLPEVEREISEEQNGQDTNNTAEAEVNTSVQEESTEECSADKDSHPISVNGSDVNFKETNGTEDHIQVSPDTATKDDLSIPSKISNFFGKFTYSPEQKQDSKQDSEISSSKKIDKTGPIHPYLSKVSGRRGIKEKLNSSATTFFSAEKEAKTPEHTGVSLDDSFRVRTNPPRLQSLELDENPTLRKFKGKRCLNAGDEPDEEEDPYLSSIKRRKLDEKTQETGILGSILWSPFKKKTPENENELKFTTTESKLSRLLSPFWFWKKSTEGQKRK